MDRRKLPLFLGADPRQYCVTAKSSWAMIKARSRRCKHVNVEWRKDAKAALIPQELPGTEHTISRPTRVAGHGIPRPKTPFWSNSRFGRDERSNVQADHGVFATNVQGVFAAGDMRRGKAWWSGPSTRAARRPANATAISWARRTCLKEAQGGTAHELPLVGRRCCARQIPRRRRNAAPPVQGT